MDRDVILSERSESKNLLDRRSFVAEFTLSEANVLFRMTFHLLQGDIYTL
jgi:hypothetical protein